VYQWVDEKGGVHFSDQPPVATQTVPPPADSGPPTNPAPAQAPADKLAAQPDDILTILEDLAHASTDAADRSSVEVVVDKIEADPVKVADKLLLRLKDKNCSENQLMIYVWAVGIMKQERAAEELVKIHRESQSERVKGNCLRSLASVGGKKAGEYLLAVLDVASDKDARFELLNLLGQMQQERALPKAEEILRLDPNQFYWQSIFVFGKMGDKAVPFLLTRISDKDRNVRANAINLLGQWQIAPEAAKAIEQQFWKEDDKELRGLELSSLEKTIPDLPRLKAVLEKVITEVKDTDLVKFARESVDMIDKSTFTAPLKTKKVSAASFQREYAQLFKSAGKKGDYKALANSSSMKDEPKLKALRERILQRNSDEAFYDYQKVSEIIMLNRLAHD
jgi:HEAT repeat protein